MYTVIQELENLKDVLNNGYTYNNDIRSLIIVRSSKISRNTVHIFFKDGNADVRNRPTTKLFIFLSIFL